jgi:hypothetical protein
MHIALELVRLRVSLGDMPDVIRCGGVAGWGGGLQGPGGRLRIIDRYVHIGADVSAPIACMHVACI